MARLLPDGYFEILSSGIYLLDEPLKLKLTPTPTSSIPTSNGDLAHLGKMSLYGHIPVFPHNQSKSTYFGLAGNTFNLECVSELQQQIDMDLPGVYRSGITGRPVPLLYIPTPPIYCETSSKGRMA